MSNIQRPSTASSGKPEDLPKKKNENKQESNDLDDKTNTDNSKGKDKDVEQEKEIGSTKDEVGKQTKQNKKLEGNNFTEKDQEGNNTSKELDNGIQPTSNKPNGDGIPANNVPEAENVTDESDKDKPQKGKSLVKESTTKHEETGESNDEYKPYVGVDNGKPASNQSSAKHNSAKSKTKKAQAMSGGLNEPELDKDKIKEMILASDTKSLNKAMKSRHVKVKEANETSTKDFSIRTSELMQQSTVKRQTSYGQLVKGSNVHRVQTNKGTFNQGQITASRSSSQSSTNSLESSLKISTVSNGSTTMSPASGMSTISPVSNSSLVQTGSTTTGTQKKEVRPKRIQVQPSSISKGTSVQGTKGKTGVSSDPKSELPAFDPTSKACVLQ